MAYNITKSDGTPITVPDGAVDTTYSANLVGRNASAYGAPVAESVIRLLENFSNIEPPAGAIQGQLWYDTSNTSLRVWTGADPGGEDISDQDLDKWAQVGGSAESDVLPAQDGINVGSADNRFDTGYFENIDTTGTITATNEGGTAISVTGNILVNGSILPSDAAPTTTDTLGSASARWDELYVTTANISGDLIFSTNIGLKAGTGAIVPTAGGINLGSSTSSQKFGTIFADSFSGEATKAQYADLAERYHADDVYSSGTLVRIGGENEITQTPVMADEEFFGVISTQPGLAMNEGAGGHDTHPYVALAGRVPVRVIGKVKKGDRLISSEVPGVAVAASEYSMKATFETLVGRALEDKDTVDEELVEATVGAK